MSFTNDMMDMAMNESFGYEVVNEGLKIDRSGRYIKVFSGKKIKGVDVEIEVPGLYGNSKAKDTDEEILGKIDQERFQKDFKVFKSSFASIEKEIFKNLEGKYEDWHGDGEFSKAKKYLHFDYAEYAYDEKKKAGSFTVGWNNTAHDGDRNKIFGGHTITAVIDIKNGKATLDNSYPRLEG